MVKEGRVVSDCGQTLPVWLTTSSSYPPLNTSEKAPSDSRPCIPATGGRWHPDSLTFIREFAGLSLVEMLFNIFNRLQIIFHSYNVYTMYFIILINILIFFTKKIIKNKNVIYKYLYIYLYKHIYIFIYTHIYIYKSLLEVSFVISDEVINNANLNSELPRHPDFYSGDGSDVICGDHVVYSSSTGASHTWGWTRLRSQIEIMVIREYGTSWFHDDGVIENVTI